MRARVLWGLMAVLGLLASACGDSGGDYSGFETSEECLRAMPVVRPEIEADALADRCGVSVGMAEIALAAAPTLESDPKPASGSSSADSAESGQGTSTSTSTTLQQTTTSTTAPATTTTLAATTLLPGGIVVPDVVGLDHQEAQDTMQAVGLRNLAEEDATGQGRRLLWDRNWIVIEQDPLAGSIVAKDTEVTLFSVKDDELE